MQLYQVRIKLTCHPQHYVWNSGSRCEISNASITHNWLVSECRNGSSEDAGLGNKKRFATKPEEAFLAHSLFTWGQWFYRFISVGFFERNFFHFFQYFFLNAHVSQPNWKEMSMSSFFTSLDPGKKKHGIFFIGLGWVAKILCGLMKN